MVTSSTHASLMYSKLSHDVPRPRFVLDSTIHIVDRNDSADALSNSTKGNRAEQLLCDHATLLLSIADIAQSEITQCPSALLEDDSNVSVIEASHHHRRITPSSLPTFPKQLDGDAYLMGSKPNLSLLPRNESLRHSMLIGSRSQRHRSVSFDSPTSVMKNIILHPWESTTSPVSSPLALPSAPKHCRTPRLDEQEKVTTPKRSNKSICQSSHAAKKARIDSPRCGSSIDHHSRNKKLLPQVSTLLLSPKITSTVTHTTNVTTVTNHQPLQETPPTGTTVRKVYRRKFSWKNYPQLEEFLIANRDAYLRHSALNYTIEQKNYNNTLTQDLLSLATKNGYIFDTTDFTFVTVRDRIRCYYKSYVQSAKKRGILMGYAAKKAGLLSKTTTKSRRSSSNSHDDDDDDDNDELNQNSWSDTDSTRY